MPRLLGIDLGTTSFKAVIYDEHGTPLASSRVSPPDEQILVDGFRVTVWRPEKLWDTMCALIRRAVDSLPDRALDAVAIAELGLVGYPVDSSGNPLYAGVTWIDPAAATFASFQRLWHGQCHAVQHHGKSSEPHLSAGMDHVDGRARTVIHARYDAMVECRRLCCVQTLRRDGARLLDGLADHDVRATDPDDAPRPAPLHGPGGNVVSGSQAVWNAARPGSGGGRGGSGPQRRVCRWCWAEPTLSAVHTRRGSWMRAMQRF